MDIKLDADGDLDVTNSELSLVSGAESVQQHWQIRNLFFLGEWFLDERIGVAYFQTIFKKGTSLALVRSIFRKVLLRTPGVVSISRFDLTFDRATRKVTIDAEGLLDERVVSGDPTFVFRFSEFIIEDQEVEEQPLAV